jgi:hypothetical protein
MLSGAASPARQTDSDRQTDRQWCPSRTAAPRGQTAPQSSAQTDRHRQIDRQTMVSKPHRCSTRTDRPPLNTRTDRPPHQTHRLCFGIRSYRLPISPRLPKRIEVLLFSVFSCSLPCSGSNSGAERRRARAPSWGRWGLSRVGGQDRKTARTDVCDRRERRDCPEDGVNVLLHRRQRLQELRVGAEQHLRSAMRGDTSAKGWRVSEQPSLGRMGKARKQHEQGKVA